MRQVFSIQREPMMKMTDMTKEMVHMTNKIVKGKTIKRKLENTLSLPHQNTD